MIVIFPAKKTKKGQFLEKRVNPLVLWWKCTTHRCETRDLRTFWRGGGGGGGLNLVLHIAVLGPWEHLLSLTNQEELFGTDILRTSQGHLRGHPGVKTSDRALEIKKEHLSLDIHDRKERTSVTLKGFKTFSVRKTFGLKFRSLTKALTAVVVL